MFFVARERLVRAIVAMKFECPQRPVVAPDTRTLLKF